MPWKYSFGAFLFLRIDLNTGQDQGTGGNCDRLVDRNREEQQIIKK